MSMNHVVKYPVALGLAILVLGGCGENGKAPRGGSTGRFPIHTEDGWGYINQDGEEVIKARYLSASMFCGDWATVTLRPPNPAESRSSNGELVSIIDRQGNVAWGPVPWEKIKYIGPVLPGLYFIKSSEGVKSVNLRSNDRFVLPEKIEDAHNRIGSFSQVYRKLIPVKIEGLWGYADLDGQIVIKPKYESVSYFSKQHHVASVKLVGGGMKIIDKHGKETTSKEYLGVTYFSEGRARASDDGKRWYLIDTKGRRIGGKEFKRMTLVSSNRVTAKNDKEGGWGVYDRDLNAVVAPGKHEYLGQYSEGLVSFVDVDTQSAGYLDRDGRRVIRLSWDGKSRIMFQPFRGALAKVKIGEREGYINQQGEWVWREE